MKKYLFIIYLTLVFYCELALSQDAGFMGPGAVDKVALSVEHQHNESARGSPKIKVESQSAAITIPLLKTSSSGLAFVAKGQRTLLSEDLKFSNAVSLPREFGSADMGLAWSKRGVSRDKDKLSVNASYGNAGTRLFSGETDTVINATISYERKRASGNAWIYFLSYSNNRTTLNNIPIPGAAYLKNGSNYNAVFGLPFMFINWRPANWVLSGALSPFGGFADSGYKFAPAWLVYANLNWSPKAYQNLIPDSDQRLIFDKKEASVGLQYSFGLIGNVAFGYVYNFDRRFVLGESLQDNNRETLEIGQATGFKLRARASF